MRLIDAHELDVLGYLEEFPLGDEDRGWNNAVNSVFAHIACAPTIDAVPVVRCGECEKRDKKSDLTDTVYCMWFMGQRRKCDFCSYGERKDGDGDGN